MKVLFLVGGFGTRIENIAKGRAKTLLPIYYEGKYQPIFYFLLDKVSKINKNSKVIDEIIVLTNDKYYNQMIAARKEYLEKTNMEIPLNIVSDHTTCNENRLGANGDLQYVKPYLKDAEDILVLAGDNYFDFELTDVIDLYNKLKQQTPNPTVIAAKEFPEERKDFVHKSFAVINVNKEGKIAQMVEKPAISGIDIDSNMAAFALYAMTKQNFNLIDTYLDSCTNPKGRDALGHFAAYLTEHTPTYPFVFTGEFVDIGTEDEYLKLQKPNNELGV